MVRIADEELLETVRRIPCLACASFYPDSAITALRDGTSRSHPHHVKTKGAGGGDTWDNVMPLCFTHHREIHDKGNKHMAATYLAVERWLLETGHLEPEEAGHGFDD